MDAETAGLDATPEDLFARYRTRGDVKALGALFDRLSPELVLRLEPASWLRGTVRDKDGEPISGIEVHHTGVSSTWSRLKVDDQGRFAIGPVPAGELEVSFTPWGYVRHVLAHDAQAEFLDAAARVIPLDRRVNTNNPEPHVPRRVRCPSRSWTRVRWK